MSRVHTLPTLALSIRQPWAWLIVNGFKDVENRTWPTPYRGPLLIHAGKTMRPAEYAWAMEFIEEFVSPDLVRQVPDMAELPLGGFVGVATLVDCVRASTSPWFTCADTEDGHGFVLADARAIEFTPWKGRLGFFNVNLGGDHGNKQ